MRKSCRSVRNQTTGELKYCRNPRQKSLSMNSATKLLNWDGRDVASMFLSLQKMPFEYLVQHQSANYRLNFIEQFSSCDPRGRRTSESVLGVWVPDTRTLPIIVLTRTHATHEDEALLHSSKASAGGVRGSAMSAHHLCMSRTFQEENLLFRKQRRHSQV